MNTLLKKYLLTVILLILSLSSQYGFAETDTPTASPTPVSTETVTETPTITPTATPTVTETETSTPTPSSTPTQTETITSQIVTPEPSLVQPLQLQSILFEKVDATVPVVSILLSKRSPFTFTKEKDRQYLLRIPSCSIGNKGQLLPQFPTNDMVGFTMAQAAIDESDTTITILIDDGFHATATMKEDAIVIKASAGGF